MGKLASFVGLVGILLHLLLMDVWQVGGSVGMVMDLKVLSNIEHRYGLTHVSSRMRNPEHQPSQLVFKVTLPQDALISSLIIEIGGTNYTGVVREKSEARRISEGGGLTKTVLVEEGKDNTQKFEVSVDVAAFDVVTFYATYEELLRRVDSRYLYTLHVHPGYRIPLAKIDVHIVEREAITDYQLLELPGQELSSHNPRTNVTGGPISPGELHLQYLHEDQPDGSGRGVAGIFTLAYDISNHSDGGEVQRVGDYFAHYFSPDNLPKMPTHTVFVLDVSHSMYNGKLDNMKTAMKSILKELSKEDTFELLAFSSDVVNVGSYSGEKKEVKKALRKIKRLVSLGYSNLNAAVLQAIKAANNYKRQAVKQIVVFSDGQATSGVTDPESIHRNVQEANINQHPIFSFAFGNDDMKLLQKISMENSGFARYMHHNSDLASQIKAFYMEISKPVIADVDIKYPESDIDPTSVVKLGTSNFYSGGEFVLAGLLIPGATLVHPVVSGIGKEGPQQLPVTRHDSRDPFHASVKDNFIARLWAFLKLKDLFAKADAPENFNHTQRLHAQALQIATQFGFVTKLSSLVVVYPDDQHITVCMKDGIRHGKNWHHAYQHESSFSGYRRLGRSNIPGNALQEYVDLDPHFIVYAQGLDLPLCFNFHSHSGAYLSLINDPQSGIIVNGQVTSATARPRMTYFTSLFLRLGLVNITITPEGLQVDCLGEDGTPQVNSITETLWPFYKKNGRRYKHGTDNKLRVSHGKSRQKSKHTMRKDKNASNRIPVYSNDHYTYRRTNNPITNNRPSSHYTYDRTNYQNDISVSNSISNQHERFASEDSQYCSQNSSWEEGVGRIYGNVMVVLSKKKNLHVMIGDGLAHFAVVRSKSKNRQRFLGFYIKDQQILSRQTHGIIGQFTAKSVRLISPTTLPVNRNDISESNVKVEVERRNRRNEYSPSVVSGVLSKRLSLLEKNHVKCIHIRGKGRGILDGQPKDYLLQCLRC